MGQDVRWGVLMLSAWLIRFGAFLAQPIGSWLGTITVTTMKPLALPRSYSGQEPERKQDGSWFIFQGLEMKGPAPPQLPTWFYLVETALSLFCWTSHYFKNQKLKENDFFSLSYLACSLLQMAVLETAVHLLSPVGVSCWPGYLAAISPSWFPCLDFPLEHPFPSLNSRALAGHPPRGSGVQHVAQLKPIWA